VPFSFNSQFQHQFSWIPRVQNVCPEVVDCSGKISTICPVSKGLNAGEHWDWTQHRNSLKTPSLTQHSRFAGQTWPASSRPNALFGIPQKWISQSKSLLKLLCQSIAKVRISWEMHSKTANPDHETTRQDRDFWIAVIKSWGWNVLGFVRTGLIFF